uniref:Fork-head domain-containing protein n=1 Tax=Mesocestoides corti TaxID=53468 RepID=A0A5K3FSC2_MESCO
MSDPNSAVVIGCQPARNMIAFEYPQSIAERRSEQLVDMKCTGMALPKDQFTSSDLVSLSWLQKGDILQITPLDSEEDPSRDDRYCTKTVTETGFKHPYKLCDQSSTLSNSLCGRISIPTSASPIVTTSYVNSAYSSTYCQSLAKPCYSYTHLIFMAIESTPAKCMTVNQIYNWCETNFPFYKHAGAGWKNSLRHNLSINKSFKRLPRDGRASNLESLVTSKGALFCESSVFFDETNSDEGPGRGAYWAVEPRERPNLLDAVKRNPWNVGLPRERPIVRPLAVNSIQPFSAVNSDISRVNFAGYASEAVLKSNGSGSLLISSSHSGASSPFSLIETNELLVERSTETCQGGISHQLQSNSLAPLTHSYLPIAISEGENPDLQESVQANANPFEPWPAEEEEKYQNMLRLLVEGRDVESSFDASIREGNSSNYNSAIDVAVKPKKEAKQRRKSSLNPTTESMCNECKENAASTCRSCSLRLFYQQQRHSTNKILKITTPMDAARVLANLNKLGAYASESALDQLLEALDDDQEVPPTNRQKRTPPVSADGEVFITPAPYHDHEYSHCQPQLRRPDETRVVEAVNTRLKQERLHLLRGLADSQTGFNFESEVLNSSAPGESIEDFERPTESSGGMEDDDYEDAGSCRFSSPDYQRPPKQQVRRVNGGSRKRGGKSITISGLMSKACRRSSRCIRAPKRPYEDFSDEACDPVDYMEEFDVYAEKDYPDSPPYTGHYQRRSRFGSYFSSSDSKKNQSDKNEAEVYDKRFRRRLPFNPRSFRPDLTKVSGGKTQIPSSVHLPLVRKRKLIDENKSRRGRRRLKEAGDSDEVLSSVDDNQIQSEVNGHLSAELDVKEVEITAERSTNQAAQILMGISQMKNFKLQSGYLSLDSSQSSEDSLAPSVSS